MSDQTPQIKIGLGIAVHNLITEEELKPLVAELQEKGIELEYKYFTTGAQASLDWLQPVIALYADSETFRSMAQSGMYDVLKFYLTTIIKTVASRTYYKLTSQTQEVRKGAITIVITTKDKAAAHYSYEGIISDTDIKDSLNVFAKSVNALQPDTDKQNISLSTFSTDQKEWITKTMKEQLQEIREAKAKSEIQ
jgi:hypothetical protein